jgi:hypothetical protein
VEGRLGSGVKGAVVQKGNRRSLPLVVGDDSLSVEWDEGGYLALELELAYQKGEHALRRPLDELAEDEECAIHVAGYVLDGDEGGSQDAMTDEEDQSAVQKVEVGKHQMAIASPPRMEDLLAVWKEEPKCLGSGSRSVSARLHEEVLDARQLDEARQMVLGTGSQMGTQCWGNQGNQSGEKDVVHD